MAPNGDFGRIGYAVLQNCRRINRTPIST